MLQYPVHSCNICTCVLGKRKSETVSDRKKEVIPQMYCLVFFLISKQPKITRIRGSSILSRMNHQTPTWVRGEEYFISEYTSLNRLCIEWQLQETKLQHAWSIAYKMSINLRCWMKSSIQLIHISTCSCNWKGVDFTMSSYIENYTYMYRMGLVIYIIYKF